MLEEDLPDYQFLGSAYYKTSKEELITSLESINSQIYKADGTILIIDGEISTDLEDVIKKYQNKMELKIVRIPHNVGLGLALREGLKYCKARYILRFDTDDYNLPNRSLKQINYIHKGEYDIISSWVYEFKENKNKPIRVKSVPLKTSDIKKSIYYRNPINHPSVCFKLTSIISLDGGYRHFPFYEDYDLWIRAIFNNLKVSNMRDTLVGMKINNQIQSRSGYKLVLCEAKLFKTFYKYSIQGMIIFIPFFLMRSIARLMPQSILSKIYNLLLRKNKD